MNTAVVTGRPCSALITIPDAEPIRLILQVKVKVVVLTITAAALTLFGSGFCFR